METMKARHAKKRPARILCGRSVCRGQLGDVILASVLEDDSTRPYFFVPGVYSKHREGKRVIYKLPPYIRDIQQRLERRQAVGHIGAEGRFRGRALAWDKPRDHLSADELPVWVQCPRCDWESEVGADLLDLPHSG